MYFVVFKNQLDELLDLALSGEILEHGLKHVLVLSGDKEQPGKVAMLGANFLLPLIACKVVWFLSLRKSSLN